MTDTYVSMLEEAVLTAEQVVAGRRRAPGKGSLDPKTIFAAADAVRAARRPAGGWHITHSVEIERNAE